MTDERPHRRLADRSPTGSPGGGPHLPTAVDGEEGIAALTESNRQLKRKIFDLYTIFEISRNFNALLDYHTLLDTFLLTSLAQVGAERGAVYLQDSDTENRFVLTKKRGSGKFPELKHAFTTASPLADHLARLNRPELISDILQHITDPAEREIIENFNPGLIVPLMFQTNLTGMMILSDKVSSAEFTMGDVEFLSILGSQISVAIENSRLYEAETKATEQLRAAQQLLVDSERLAALGELSAKVAHEVNNPLGIIKNYMLLLKRSVADNPESLEYAEITSQEIDRIARIVKELLNFHRPKKETFRKTDLVQVIEETLTLLKTRYETQDIKVVTEMEPDLPTISASPENLKQVIMNIVMNACDIMPEGGTLTVQLKREDMWLVLSFSDTGPGIPDETVPRIFEPFYTTKEAGKGTGLGLSVCYGIVKQHDGAITYRNLPDGGSFVIRLPIPSTEDTDE